MLSQLSKSLLTLSLLAVALAACQPAPLLTEAVVSTNPLTPIAPSATDTPTPLGTPWPTLTVPPNISANWQLTPEWNAGRSIIGFGVQTMTGRLGQISSGAFTM